MKIKTLKYKFVSHYIKDSGYIQTSQEEHLGRLRLNATVGDATRRKRVATLGEVSLKKQSCSSKTMTYLVINAITGILCECFDINVHIHLLMMQLPRQQWSSWRLNHRACSQGATMRTCAILSFFFSSQSSPLT